MEYIVCPNCAERFPNTESHCPKCGLEMVLVAPKDKKKETATLYTLAYVFGFLDPIVGLVLAIIGTATYKNEGYKDKSKGAIFLSIGMMLAYLFLAFLIFVSGFNDRLWSISQEIFPMIYNS